MENNHIQDPKTKKSNFKGLIIVLIIVILSIIGYVSIQNNKKTNTSTTVVNQQNINNVNTVTNSVSNTVIKEYKEIFSLTDKGNRDSESFSTTGGKIKLVAQTTGGTVGSFSSIELKSENGEYLSGASLNISTEGTEPGNGETIIRNAEAGEYFISVISGINWDVKVFEEK